MGTGTVPPQAAAGDGSGDMLASNNLSDVASAATSRTNLGLAIGTNVQPYDADLTTLGALGAGARSALGLAIGTDVAALTGVNAARESIIIAVGDETTAITTGTAKVTFRMPYAFTLTAVRGSLTTADSTGAALLTIDVNETGTTVLSTKLTFDATETTTTTAATPAVISDAALADDASITIDVDLLGTGANAAGLKIALIGYKT